jgi:hypothetical protein
MRTSLLIICLLLPGALLFAAGCTEEAIAIEPPATTPSPTPTPTAVMTPSVSEFLSVSLVSEPQKYIGNPPYWEVRVRVDNNGPVDAYGVVTGVRLIDVEDGTPGPWKTKTYECIIAGDYKVDIFKIYPGDDREYRAEVQITSSQDDR